MFSSISGLYDSNSKPNSSSKTTHLNSGKTFKMDPNKSKYSLSFSFTPPNSRTSNINNHQRRNSLEPLVTSPSRSSISLGMLANVSSPGLSSRIVKYGNENMNWTKSSEHILTQHPLYRRPGELPQVRLGKNRLLPKLTPKNTQSLGWKPVTIRIAPPHSNDNRLYSPEKNDILKENSPSKSVLDTLREMSRKRIHSQLELGGNSPYEDEECPKRECKRDDLEDNVTPKTKRDREESPKSGSNTSPSNNRIKRFAPSIKGTNEVYASLSSSRNLFERKMRYSQSRDWSRSSSPDNEFSKKSKIYISPNSISKSIQTDLLGNKNDSVTPDKSLDNDILVSTLKSKSCQTITHSNNENENKVDIKSSPEKIIVQTPRRKIISSEDTNFDSGTVSLQEYINQRMKNKSRLGSLLVNMVENKEQAGNSSSNEFSVNKADQGIPGIPLSTHLLTKGKTNDASLSSNLLLTSSDKTNINLPSSLSTNNNNFNSGLSTNLTESSTIKPTENANLLTKSPSLFSFGSKPSNDKPAVSVEPQLSSTISTSITAKNSLPNLFTTSSESTTTKTSSEQLLTSPLTTIKSNPLLENNKESLPSLSTNTTIAKISSVESQNKTNETFVFDSSSTASNTFGSVTSLTNVGIPTSSSSSMIPLTNSSENQTNKQESASKTTTVTIRAVSAFVFGSSSSDTIQTTSGNTGFIFNNNTNKDAKKDSSSGESTFVFKNDNAPMDKENPSSANSTFVFKKDNALNVKQNTTENAGFTFKGNQATESIQNPLVNNGGFAFKAVNRSDTNQNPLTGSGNFEFKNNNSSENKPNPLTGSENFEFKNNNSSENKQNTIGGNTTFTFKNDNSKSLFSPPVTSSISNSNLFGNPTLTNTNSPFGAKIQTTEPSKTTESSTTNVLFTNSSTTKPNMSFGNPPVFASTTSSSSSTFQSNSAFSQVTTNNNSLSTPSVSNANKAPVFNSTSNATPIFGSNSKSSSIFGQPANLNSTFTMKPSTTNQDSGFGNSNPSKDAFGKPNASQPFNQPPGNTNIFGNAPSSNNNNNNNNNSLVQASPANNNTFSTNLSTNIFSNSTTAQPNIFGSNSIAPSNLFGSNLNNNPANNNNNVDKTTPSLFGSSTTPTFSSSPFNSNNNNMISKPEITNSPFSNTNGQGDMNKPQGLFSFGTSANQQVTSKDPNSKPDNLFTFGAKASGEPSSAGFNFGAQQSNTATDSKPGGFAFSNPNTGFSNQSSGGFNFSGQTPQAGSFTFQAGGQVGAGNMFNIGSGSTAPRIKPTRPRRMKN